MSSASKALIVALLISACDYPLHLGTGIEPTGDARAWGDDRPVLGTCRNACGQQALDLSCWCDPECERRENCCPDKEEICGAPPLDGTCAGNCGEFDPETGCWCDDACAEYGDCCEDKLEHCPPSCRNHCGAGIGECACDEWCTELGDCCTDFATACGFNTYGDVVERCGGTLCGTLELCCYPCGCSSDYENCYQPDACL